MKTRNASNSSGAAPLCGVLVLLIASTFVGVDASPAEVVDRGAIARPTVHDRLSLPRIIVTTDGEADDINSFIRLLYYANELDIAGLVYSSSVHHWTGDGVHTLKQAREAGLTGSYRGETAGSAARSDDARAWRWEPVGWMERNLLEGYARIYPNLLQHDPNYPSPAHLWSKVAVGNVRWENEFHTDTAGSELIKAALLDEDRRKLYLQAWGGANTIARALLSIETQFKSTPEWNAIQAKVNGKAVLVAIGQQDNAWQDYISRSWPDIPLVDFNGAFGGFSSYMRSQVPPDILPYYRAGFWSKHIKYGHGPLLEGYGLIGDGTWFEGEGDNPGWQPGQAKDLSTFKYFGFLTGFERLDWTGEGDTPAFISLIPTGLRFIENPNLGSWGGRLQQSATRGLSWVAARDANPHTGQPTAPYTVIRWMPEIANDFAARADWGVSSRFEDANHPPRIVVGGADRTAAAGESVDLDFRVADPDGDRLAVHWWIYTDASTAAGAVVAPRGSGRAGVFAGHVKVPASAAAGERIVVVANVVDAGVPALTRHAQFVITVAR